MLVEKFNDVGFQIDLNTGNVLNVTKSQSMGIGDIVNNSIVALYAQNKTLFLKVGNENFDVSNSHMTYEYFHNNNITTFKVFDSSKRSLEIQYPCWMLKETIPIGFGVNDDDEEDFLAYAKLMLESEDSIKFLLKKYTV